MPPVQSETPSRAIETDWVGLAARQAAIAQVMGVVRQRRLRLKEELTAGVLDDADAARRNSSMPGWLGQIWAEFIALPLDDKLAALDATHFQCCSWQALLQCSPYFPRHLPSAQEVA